MIPPVLEQSTEPRLDRPKVNGNCLSTGGPIRLNLGGIGDAGIKLQIPPKIDGFLTVDIQNTPAVDIVTDCCDLSMFNDATVDEIYASNILEHWPHTQTVDVLKEWRRVMKRGGKLWISVPDIDAVLRLVAKRGLVQWAINLIWGDQIHPYAYHYINFTFATLAKAVNEAGFSDIRRLALLPYGLPDASRHRDNVEFKLISLNVEVTA